MGPASDAAFVLAISLWPPSIDRGGVEIETFRTMVFFFAPSRPEEYRQMALQTPWINAHNLGSGGAVVAPPCYSVIEAESCG